MEKIKIYLQDYNNVMSSIKTREEFEIVDDARDCDCIVLWQDVRAYLQELCVINKIYMHKPVVVVQHGRAASNDYLPPNNFPMIADKFCCWGERDRQRLIRAGYGDRAVVTGSPLTRFLKPKKEHNGKNIVYQPIMFPLPEL